MGSSQENQDPPPAEEPNKQDSVAAKPQLIQPDNEMISFSDLVDGPNLFKYHIAADGNLSSGNLNRELFAFRTGFDLDVHKAFRFSSSPFFIFGRQNKVINERELFADLKGSGWYRKKIHPVGFVSAEKSNLRKINLRRISAIGLAWNVVIKPKASILLTNVILHEDTRYVPNEKFTDRTYWRNAIKLQGEYKLTGDKLVISHLLNLQPAINQSNIRWNANMVIRYMINKHISFRTILEDYYESLVVPGRKKNDFRVMFGLSVDGVK